MMTLYFYVGLLIYSIIFALRFYCSAAYLHKQRHLEGSITEENYTIVQPILSGDPKLEEKLTANLKNTRKMQFMWLVDKSDNEGQRITENMRKNALYSKRVTILYLDDVPQNTNPKVFKLKQALADIKTTYTVILDDDSVIDQKYFNEMSQYEALEEEWLVTGIPYNDAEENFFSRLVAAFVNSQSHLTYFPMALVGHSYTINGMFYIGKTALFKKYNVYEEIEKYLCDDYELAKYLRERGVRLIQSTIPCHVQTTVSGVKNYIQLMKRWLVFTNHYLKENVSLVLLMFIMIPGVFPLILFAVGFSLGWRATSLFIIIILVKNLINARMRKYIFQKKESLLHVLLEGVSDLILPLIYVYALLRPHTVQWRNRKIVIKGRDITYE